MHASDDLTITLHTEQDILALSHVQHALHILTHLHLQHKTDTNMYKYTSTHQQNSHTETITQYHNSHN